MKIDKKILSLAKNIASKEKYRPALCGVYLDNNKIVATDSFKMVKIEYGNLEKPFDSKLIDKKEIEKEKELESIPAKELWTAKFPDKYECFYDNENNHEIGVTVEHLMAICKVYKDAWQKTMRIQLNTENRNAPIHFESDFLSSDTKDFNIKSILMALKL